MGVGHGAGSGGQVLLYALVVPELGGNRDRRRLAAGGHGRLTVPGDGRCGDRRWKQEMNTGRQVSLCQNCTAGIWRKSRKQANEFLLCCVLRSLLVLTRHRGGSGTAQHSLPSLHCLGSHRAGTQPLVTHHWDLQIPLTPCQAARCVYHTWK